MSFTRRYIVGLAAALKNARVTPDRFEANRTYHNSGVDCAAHRVADLLQCVNPEFDRKRFLKDCGVTS